MFARPGKISYWYHTVGRPNFLFSMKTFVLGLTLFPILAMAQANPLPQPPQLTAEQRQAIAQQYANFSVDQIPQLAARFIVGVQMMNMCGVADAKKLGQYQQQQFSAASSMGMTADQYKAKFNAAYEHSKTYWNSASQNDRQLLCYQAKLVFDPPMPPTPAPAAR